jgi:hypothetical protein
VCVCVYVCVCGVSMVQMHLPGPCLRAGALALRYGATNVSPAHKDNPPPHHIEGDIPFLDRSYAGEGQRQFTALPC